jgi:hypothetical protein
MVINLSAVQPFLLVLLPLIMPYIGDFSASVLAQDGFPQFVNDLIAWVMLIAVAIASGIASGALIGPFVTADWTTVISVLIAVATALLAGPLTSLNTWVNFTALVQSHVFNIVPAVIALITPAPRPSIVQAQPAPVANFAAAQRTPEPIVLQPRQQSVAPQVASPQVAQVPFPPVNTLSAGAISASAPLSFGDTGIVPTLK